MDPVTEKPKRRRRYLIPVIVIALLAGAFFWYVGDYRRADAAAGAAMGSDEKVRVITTDYGWLFDGTSEENALIFYPGGKVECTAYAPLCRALAQNGFDVCLVEMPFRLAVFGKNRAEEIIGSPDYLHWYIGGHSLGGVMAAFYAADHEDELDGVVLLAAYTTKRIGDGLKTLLIYGTEDGVLNMEKYRKNLENVPEHATEYVIEGGNHSQFGSYGTQSGDGQARISPEQQVEETARIIKEKMLP